MKQIVAVVVAAAALGALIAVGYPALFPSEERRIRTRLDQLVETINTPTGESFDALARAARIGNAFTPDVLVDFGEGAPLQGRETVMAVASRFKERARTFTVTLRDVAVVVSDDRASADVGLTAVVTTDDSTDAREFQLRMSKPEGTWLIARATAERVLQK